MSKEAMKRFLIETSVENAEGSQTWYVDATSEAEALEQYEQGGCDLYASNVDVTSLGEPEISGETTLDDFGDFAAEQPAQQCRTDGRCQYAIDSGAEGMGHCPKGKCVMPAQQEPVAWMTHEVSNGTQVWLYEKTAQRYQNPPTPLYTSPQRTWVELTDEEQLKLAQDSMGKSRHWLVAEVEAKLKEKNT